MLEILRSFFQYDIFMSLMLAFSAASLTSVGTLLGILVKIKNKSV